MMKTTGKVIWRWLKSRLGRNIIFWLLFLGEWWYAVPIPKDYPAGWYILFRVTFTMLMLALTYFNNLFLLPRLLANKKYWLYFLVAITYTYLIGFLIALNFNVMMHDFPKMKIEQESFMTTEIPLSYAWKDMLEGATNYFWFIIDWVFSFNMAWYVTNYAIQQRQMEEAKRKQMETELSFLKSQMNPHFLFNTLNNLYGLALKQSPDTPEVILKLSSILRYLLYESEYEKVGFYKEKEVMNAYINLELLRLQQKENLNFAISADKDYELPPLLWLPVLENVFKHATRVISESYFIDYRFEIKDNVLEIYSENNYKNGMGRHTDTKSGGFGLENLEKRLDLLFPDKYVLQSGPLADHYATQVKINLA